MPLATKRKSTTPRLRGVFRRTKETKGTVVYSECDSDGEVVGKGGEVIIGTIYIKKDAIAKLGNPDTIKVMVKKG